jgi:predicted Zn-dependent peptidase
LPEHYSRKLAKELEKIVKSKKKKKEPLSAEEVDKIRMAFFNFFVSVFKDYEQYIIHP